MNCTGCGAVLAAGFNFCPNCGRSARGSAAFGALLDESFSRLESSGTALSAERLDRLDEHLRALESELDRFVEEGHCAALRRR